MKWAPLLTLPLLLGSWWAISHGGGHPTRYVSSEGSDEGECATSETTCASIRYALSKSTKGDKVLVAAGLYPLDELDVFYLLSEMVVIEGGYSVADKFSTQDSSKNPSTIIGVPFSYREQLAERGFLLQQDQKSEEIGLSANQSQWLNRYQKLTSFSSSTAECVEGLAGDNPCHNIDRLAHIPLNQLSAQPSSANDIWGYVDLNTQKEYVLIGLNTGTAIVDISNASAPTEVAHISGVHSTWRDIKVYQYFDEAADSYKAYAYVTTEGDQGLQIIDLNPAVPVLAATLTRDFRSAHNVVIANVDYSSGVALAGQEAALYVAGSNSKGGVFIRYSLEDPLSPTKQSEGTGYIHDGTSFTIDDTRTADCVEQDKPCDLFIDFNENSVDIWDVSNAQAPNIISRTIYNNLGYVHSGWWSEDKQTLFIQDELDERDYGLPTTLRALDISDLKKPTMAGIYQGKTQAIDHNGFALGNLYYMSNYRRGLSVIDVSDPSNMVDYAYFDTFAVPEENSAGFNGAWGVYPFFPSGSIVVSDIEYGLWVLKLNANDGDFPLEAQPTPLPTATSSPSPNTSGGSGGGSSSILLLFMLLLLKSVRREAISKR